MEVIDSEYSNLTLYTADCLEVMSNLESESFDVVVTSPPYNLNINYGTYQDKMPFVEYLSWTHDWISQVKRLLKPDGSFFLNVSGSPKNPWIPQDVATVARDYFTLQNRIMWVKSISIDGKTSGHFKPINSKRFLNDTHEFIFHFTKEGNISLDRLAVGVPYEDKSNVARWKSGKTDLRCAGNTWYIPYKTVQSKKDKYQHPAAFPVGLPERCIKLHGNAKLVLDPFGGVGSTAVACKRLKTNCVLIDVDAEYNLISRKRFDDEVLPTDS